MKPNQNQPSIKQRQQVQEGLDQLTQGEFIPNEQVEMEIDKWLNEK